MLELSFGRPSYPISQVTERVGRALDWPMLTIMRFSPSNMVLRCFGSGEKVLPPTDAPHLLPSFRQHRGCPHGGVYESWGKEVSSVTSGVEFVASPRVRAVDDCPEGNGVDSKDESGGDAVLMGRPSSSSGGA